MALISDEGSRTMRFGILTAIFNLAPEMGLKFGLYFYEHYIALLLMYFCLLVIGLVVLILVESQRDSDEADTSVERYCVG